MMTNQEPLRELTESYLKSVIAEAGSLLDGGFDSFAPFAELGIDSFRVLKIIRTLESEFGTLPKTLLFENFNVNDLARYFVDKHESVLTAKFASRLAAAPERPANDPPPAVAGGLRERAEPQAGARADVALPALCPLLMLEKDAYAHPELGRLVRDLFDRYRNEGSVSRGARNIAPNLFLGSERRGYFNYSRSKNIILAYAYTGPEDYFDNLARELYQHCIERNFHLTMLTDRIVGSVGDVPFSSTAFGALQRVVNLQEFSLEGGAMRRLRYQVTKFEKAGACRTEEYRCGTRPETDRQIAAIIDKWCTTRTIVNPLVPIVREEILAGSLHPQHRLFLTYVDEVLQNVILISALSPADNGYLMDLEFYGEDMPQGGLEFAIVRIIEMLAAEGSNVLSLGGTYGCRIDSGAHADPEVDKILEELHRQKVFNDDSNLQFKNKFRPQTRPVYLCRPAGSGHADNVIDIIMMIADPAKMQTSDAENHAVATPASQAAAELRSAAHTQLPATPTAARHGAAAAVQAQSECAASIEGEERSATLAQYGFNPLNIPATLVEFDLKTDSWAQLKMPAIDARMKHLHAELQQPVDLQESLRGIFPFTYFALTASGRDAERVFYKAWPRKGLVLQNLLFPTGLFNQIDNGFEPCELPHPQVLRLDAHERYQGDLAWEALQRKVADNPDAIALVCVELSNNAAGGHPVSAQHLRELKALLVRHAIPLVVDGTRIVENARLLLEQESQYAGKSIWAVAQDILSYANAVICSLPKDFCVTKGGVIATNDAKLFRKLQDLIQQEGVALDAIDQKLIALSLQDRKRIETQVLRRMEGVQSLCRTLTSCGIPVVRPAGAHCVLIDVKQVTEFQSFEHPVASFLAWMYLGTGIRAGAHSVGMQKRTPINDLVRVAVPIGLKQAQIDEIAGRLINLFRSKSNIPELTLDGPARGGDVNAVYQLKQYHRATSRLVAAPAVTTVASTTAHVAVASQAAPAPRAELATAAASQSQALPVKQHAERSYDGGELQGTHRVRDIAIIGMAGRYPKAANVTELWRNLANGVDCITDLPEQRYERRSKYEDIDKYRGGFIDDVDRFDSLFFNISPREAEMLDPQERLFLEVAWEAVEDAGYYPEILAKDASRNVGVFVGAVWAMYQMIGLEERHVGNKVSPNSFLWSIANRVSYFMNLAGPSLTLDTACSSSLTAIHLACEAIYSGECSGAIVGGVNLDLHQGKLDINLVGGALSKDGVCRSFGRGANGYVAGEGVGALVLKPLEEAVRDGDNIHGVIKSIAVNHGGRTSGFTVPNPKAQARIIRAALEKAQIDARTIGYIEAHGTGTELGDPIETTGLTQAFEPYGVANQSCALGSIKTNIGHLEAAAGVVGVCKVLLQMRHRALAPSLHSAQLNEFIDFEHSPLYVVQKLEQWQPKEVDGVRWPLRAGVSSFGAGGSNAHIILEGYDPPAITGEEPPARPTERMFPLSARNEEQLRQVALRLRSHLQEVPQEQAASRRYLDSVSYTLQVGRKSFDCRVVIIASSLPELLEGLSHFIEGRRDERILSGNIKNAEGITRLLSRREQEEFINLLARSRDARKLAQLWIDGLLGDWQGFHPRGSGRRVSLPTYPFADRRHWVPNSLQSVRRTAHSVAGIHPLLDSNESTFERQLFKKTFHDRDFFIYDHLVADIATLPGVAYLELARKAGEIAAGRKVQRIRNILWLSPIAVRDAPKDVLIELKPNGEVVHFEVFSDAENGQRVVHSQGKLLYATPQEIDAQPEYIDLQAIRSRCTKVMDGARAYPMFKSFGLNLGPSFQSLQEVYKNSNETLGALQLPQPRHADLQNMLLHPSLVDGSLQAGVAAQLGDEAGEMLVPYSLGEVEILHPLPTRCFSYVTKEDQGKSRVSKGNVLIVDEHGKILVRIRESTGVPLMDVHKKPQAEQAADFATLHYAYEWEKAPLQAAGAAQEVPRILLFASDGQLRDLYARRAGAAAGRDAVILVQPGGGFAQRDDQTYTIDPRSPADFARLIESLIERHWSIEKICFAWALDISVGRDGADVAVEESLDRGVYALLFLYQALIKAKVEGRVQLLYPYLVSGEQCQAQHDAINGFAKALHIEHPKFFCKTLAIHGGDATAEGCFDLILAELASGSLDAASIRYQQGERHARRIRPFDLPVASETDGSPARTALRERGVYVITGGAGGLGLIFAQFLAKQCKARLVLTGRSSLSAELEAKLEPLRQVGAEVLYMAADVSKPQAVEEVIGEARRRFGEVNGVIHSAGVLRDSYIRNKTREEMSAVLAPKLHGTLNLDEATRQEPLDFFVTFSSMSAVGGNAGQCDYCFANHFMDSFARQRESLRARGERSGRTLSINWSLWAEGGMRLDKQTQAVFTKATGITPLQTQTGLRAFTAGLAADTPQLVVVEGLQEKIELSWGLRKKESTAAAQTATAPQAAPAPAVAAAAAASAAGDGELLGMVQRELTQIAVEFLKADVSDVAPDKVLLDLGFDSIGLATYANQINDKYGLDITPVLFFDYPSIEQIAGHLCAERRDEVLRFHDAAAPAQVPAAAQPPAAVAAVAQARQPAALAISKGWNPQLLEQPAATAVHYSPARRFIEHPVAIVGMSGIMPESADLDEFWANLRDGRDMISVIPKDRWKWEEYYGDPLKEVNKSNSKWGGFMKEVDKFDPLFFGISPREAQMMDPQQRLFLQTVWKAIEDSGHKVSDLHGTKTGLFVGVATNDYADMIATRGIGLDGYTASGNSHSVLANRVSFLLNLRGPSAPLDTACSSSLVALHRAIESIHTGSSDMAIVGGVQVMLSPAAYISFSMAGMLSGDGKCKTFDKRANGYVRGEGVGAVFLKPLSMAQADGNHIYALVKATAENHGGRVTTLTAPNSNAQIELLIEAYEKAEIDPTTVGFIECHGTGTSLGDPIEIQALSKAFAELYKRNRKQPAAVPHCGLSSVKTNIGHLETAAGIAGILKTLLAIKHQQIPANVHFEELNPYINLAGTPFYIADKTVAWEAPVDEHGARAPRRAGVSSFGFGGANAHVVLEEYIQTPRDASAAATGPQLIVLSAKNEERLNAYAKLMLEHLRTHEVDLADFAYTLQVGRDEMPERLALIVSSAEEIKEKLSEFSAGAREPIQSFRGNTKNRKSKTLPAERKVAADVLQGLLHKGELATLAELWVSGAEIDWRLLHAGRTARRLSVPTYPFAQERYWLPEESGALEGPVGAARLHPLVHRNVSTLQEQKFAATFSGEEFFLADHVVDTDRILPGVAYMEIARVAGQLAGEKPVRSIRNLVWLAPLIVGAQPRVVEVSIAPRQQQIEFTVRSSDADRTVIHCTGQLSYSGKFEEPAALDIAAIRQRCSKQTLTAQELYPYLSSAGLNLGRSFQIVETIHATAAESLSVLKLPAHLKAEAEQFWLHPALMDGSLHTAIGLMREQGMDLPLSLPFTVREIQILRPLTDLYYGYATWVGDAASADPSQLKINFHLLDRQGNVLVRMKEFVSKPLKRLPAKLADQAAGAAPGDLHALVPVWDPVAVAAQQLAVPASTQLLLLGSDPVHLQWAQRSFPSSRLLQLSASSSAEILETKLIDCAFDQLLWIAPDVLNSQPTAQEQFIEEQERGVLAVFRVIKALLSLGFANKPLHWTLITSKTQQVKAGEAIAPSHASILGLVGSLAKEYPHWKVRLLDVESLESVSAEQCLSLPWDQQGSGLAYRRGEWFRQGFARVAALPQAPVAYRQGGVYVVIGGAGGLGEVWSRALIEQYQARMVWIGRKECTEAIQHKIDELGRLGPKPLYIAADATRFESLQQAFDRIREVYPAIHGVVHSAIVLNDQSIGQMDECAFKASLSAKVDVSVNMARVFGRQTLDFMLFFSSITAFYRSPGQSNYAAGCTFKDAFAHWLQQQCSYPVKIMNWGYWGEVGVVANAASIRKRMELMGLGSISPREGMQSLQALVSGALKQVVLAKTFGTRSLADVGSFDTIAHYPAATAQDLPQIPATLGAPDGQACPVEPQVAERDTLATQILAATLSSIGCFGGQATDARSPVAQAHRHWLTVSIRHLQQQGWLDESLTLTRQVEAPADLWVQWDEAKAKWTAHERARTILLEACLKALPDILRGKQAASEVIRTHLPARLTDRAHLGSTVEEHFHELLAQTLAACIEQWRQRDESRRIRILEIGRGTPDATAKLLAVVQRFGDTVCEYRYTNLAQASLTYAVEHYRPQCPVLTTAILDVTKPFASQGIEAAGFDVVIASNVLHATPGIRQAVRNAKAALRTHGVLLLDEICGWSLFSHLTQGLLEQSWQHEDSALRLPGSPALGPESWHEVLLNEGFAPVVFAAEGAHALGRQVIAASSDGVVRQAAAKKVAVVPDAAQKAPAHARDAALPQRHSPATPKQTVNPPAVNRRPTSSEVSEQMGRDHIEQIIIGQLSQALKLDAGRIRNEESFADYGVDSIVGVNLVRTINETLHIELDPTSLFEHNTVARLTDYIWSNWRQAVAGQLAPAGEGLPVEDGDVPSFDGEPDFQYRLAGASLADPAQDAAADAGVEVRTDAIAIIGMSGRFAQSESLHEFWQMLVEGTDLVKEVTRWNASECVIADDTSHGYCSHGSFVDSLELFDPAFFRISPLEARYMDPQQRLFLEESWKALEDAGYAGKSVREKQCGVYVGCGNSKYEELFAGAAPAQAFWGNSESVVPARIAYYLDLQGPAIAVNTACSSSLVTIHLACQGLWSRETEMALAGGVFLQATAGFYQVANRAGMLSPKGRCQSFDAKADGFVPGEGVGVIVLKRLADALKDGDSIHAVIAGSGINQDGASNGLTAPNAAAQERLERFVYERFDIDPAGIQLVEAHGTGTVLGDSIEFGAITRAFRRYTDKTQFCAIGSVKTNIGHAATAAGIASVLKVLLALKHRQLPPSLHFGEANPAIDFASSPFYVNTQAKPWDVEEGQLRRAAVSSFGFSGTNAHLVIEEAPPVRTAGHKAPACMVVLSARTQTQLGQQVRNLLSFLKSTPEVSLNDLSYTLLVGRMHMDRRLACIARTQQELIKLLEQWVETGSASQTYVAELSEGRVRERPSLRKFGNHCIQQCRSSGSAADYLEHLSTIADLYVQGYSLDFQLLFAPGSRRMPLPTYPFARERYWPQAAGATASAANAAHALHPLLHVNTSDLSQHSYSSTFSGQESFLRDHQVVLHGGVAQKVMPAGAYLEMARAALDKSMPASGRRNILELRNAVFAEPIIVTEPRHVSIALLVNGDEAIDFEIYSAGVDQPAVHCQGQALFNDESAPAPLDIEQLRGLMRLGSCEPDELYAELSGSGLHVGAAHRVVALIHRGEKQRLAQLRLPALAVSDRTNGGYWLHPSLLEGALQACSDLLASEGVSGPVLLPTAWESVRIAAPCTGEMLAWVRFADSPPAPGADVAFNIDLIDDSGKLCVQIRTLSFHTLRAAASDAQRMPAASGADAASVGAMSPEDKIELFLVQEIAQQLSVPAGEVALDLSYIDLGMTSLGIAGLIHAVNQHLDANLSPNVAFTYRNVATFADFLAKTYPEKVSALSVARAGRTQAQNASGQSAAAGARLSPLPRRAVLTGTPTPSRRAAAAPRAGERQLLDTILWQDGADESDYETVTL